MIVDNKTVKKRKRGVLNLYYQQEQEQFLVWLYRMGYAKDSIKGHKSKIGKFFRYLQNEKISDITQIKKSDILNYNAFLHSQGIGGNTIQSDLSSLIRFSAYLEKTTGFKLVTQDLVVDPTLFTERTILTQEEVKSLFALQKETPEGLRNKALLHLYYSCGLRAAEGIRVHPKHLDYQKQLLYVVPGKNYRGRYVPLSTSVVKDLKTYEQYSRRIINPHTESFLANPMSNRATKHNTCYTFKRILKASSLNKHVTLHGMRHSIATHLLQSGMSLESIGQFLGHQTLEATQIYVRMNHQLAYESKSKKL